MADMQVIFNLLKELMPKVYEILEEKEENCGDFIGNNLINQGLNNLFTNDLLNNDTSLLIWDLLFLEGNFILIKSFLAIYACLQNKLLKSERSIITFKDIIDKDLKNIKPDNEELINILFIKKFNFDENYINEERFKFSSQIAEAFENNTIDIIKSKLKVSYDKQLDVQLDKTINCNKNWPYCVNDTYFENVTQIVFYTTLSKQKLGEYEDDWFFEKLKLKNEKKMKEKKDDENYIIEKREENRYNIAIERRPHYCSQASEDIINKKKSEEIIGNNIDINKEMENKIEKEKDKKDNNNIIIDNNENNIDKDKKVNKINEQNSNTTTTTSIKSDSEEINFEEDMK